MNRAPKLHFLAARIALLGVLAFSAACGVKGDLERPPGTDGQRPRGEIIYPPGGAERAPESDTDADGETR